MASTTIKITLISAKDLIDTRSKPIRPLKVYAVITLSNNPMKEFTPTDSDGGSNPEWNKTFSYSVPAKDINHLAFDIVLMCEGPSGSDRNLGSVHIPIKDLFGDNIKPDSTYKLCRLIRKPATTRTRGVLNLSYRFYREKKSSQVKPSKLTSEASASTGKPNKSENPPQQNTQFGYPAYGWPRQYGQTAWPPNYGYDQPPMGYRPPPRQLPDPKPPRIEPADDDVKFLGGMALGFLAGAVGALALGDSDSDED